eukprot:TRINITY_DN2109_c0_g1_i8.p1 TRINITY_DN2109_c0_g1~~TRINITY_DN2109_c0_g1_i8.p1  ORF type:complete len:306 (+),score=30.65 TRINITY_DN2109_c0_g1_i8:161-1078(+)
MASKAVVLMFVACLRFADIGNGVRRDWEEEDDVDEGSIDLAHEKQRSLDRSLFLKGGKGKPPSSETSSEQTAQGDDDETGTIKTRTTITGQKLNVLVLHGTAQSGPEMKRYFDNLRVTGALKDIANLYYPTGPHVVPRWHPLILFRRKQYSQNNRHWYNMGSSRNFKSSLFNAARRTISEFVDKKIPGDVDVIVGYAQGAAAATQVLNDVNSGKIQNEKLKKIQGAIFLAVPTPGSDSAPSVSREVGQRVKSLHCQGRFDTINSVRGARRHAAAFKKDTFHVYMGGHSLTSLGGPIRRFLLSLRR